MVMMGLTSKNLTKTWLLNRTGYLAANSRRCSADWRRSSTTSSSKRPWGNKGGKTKTYHLVIASHTNINGVLKPFPTFHFLVIITWLQHVAETLKVIKTEISAWALKLNPKGHSRSFSCFESESPWYINLAFQSAHVTARIVLTYNLMRTANCIGTERERGNPPTPKKKKKIPQCFFLLLPHLLNRSNATDCKVKWAYILN